MQNLSHDIERYILNLLEGVEENFISLRRKELAEKFECVPSQINYVLRSRFTPEQGYLIESRRGEHGYIKIFRITCETPDALMEHIDGLIGDSISLYDAHRLLETLHYREIVTVRERLLMEIALRNIAYEGQNVRSEELAALLRDMLGGILSA